jgi:hypothetical protein
MLFFVILSTYIIFFDIFSFPLPRYSLRFFRNPKISHSYRTYCVQKASLVGGLLLFAHTVFVNKQLSSNLPL